MLILRTLARGGEMHGFEIASSILQSSKDIPRVEEGSLYQTLQRILVRRSQFDADLEDEMRLHVELRAQEQVEAGAPTNEAAYAARRRFGNTVLLREVSRETWGWSIARSVAAGHPLWLADAGEES